MVYFGIKCSRMREVEESRMSQAFGLSNWADRGAIYWQTEEGGGGVGPTSHSGPGRSAGYVGHPRGHGGKPVGSPSEVQGENQS